MRVLIFKSVKERNKELINKDWALITLIKVPTPKDFPKKSLKALFG